MKSLKTMAIAGLIAWYVASSAQAYDMEINITAEVALEGCLINNGADEQVNFGAFASDMLVPGAPAPGIVLMQPVVLPLECAGSSNVQVNASFQATPAAGNGDTIATSSTELGIAIAATPTALSSSDSWIKPNSGVLPVQLDASGNGTIHFYTTPIAFVSPLQPGPFTAQAVVNIAYP